MAVIYDEEDGFNEVIFENADESFNKDKEFVVALVKKDGFALEFVDESFAKDKEVVLAAVQQDSFALEHADESLQNDPDILAIVNKDK